MTNLIENYSYFELFVLNLLSVFLGFSLKFTLSRVNQKWVNTYHQTLTYCLLPPITAIITSLISSNIALSLGMIGALSIVRFRTPIRTPYELVHYFSLLTIGISAKVDLSITVVLIIILSALPYFIKRFSLMNESSSGSDGKLRLNFQGLITETDLKKIIGEKSIKNYSVKNEGDKLNFSGFALFSETKEKDIFLKEWSSKINSYNVDTDENN